MALQQARRDSVTVTQDQVPDIQNETGYIKQHIPLGGANSEDEADVEILSDDSSDSNRDDDYFSAEDDEENDLDHRTRILSVVELESWLLKMAPDLSGE